MYPDHDFGVLFYHKLFLELDCNHATREGQGEAMENTGERKGMSIPENRAVWGSAFVGGILGSIVIGILCVLYVYDFYPNSEFEHSAAIVGVVFGSFFSIPFGFFGGGIAGGVIYNFLSRRNSQRPASSAKTAAFVISALLSGVSLVPIGFILYGFAHI
jgi:hypothetical protein